MKSVNLKTLLPAGGVPIARLIPNITTLLGLSIGLTALLHAMNHEWERALWFVVVATIFDAMDGRLARLFNATSRFGAELDSLSDFVVFGVSPAIIAYMYSWSSLGKIGWGILLFFCICSSLRLARFNTASIAEELEGEIKKSNYFTGVPITSSGLLVLMPIMLMLDLDFVFPSWTYGLYAIVIGCLMVSRIPTLSLKGIKVTSKQLVPVLLVVTMLTIGLLMRPWLTFPIVGFVYMGSFFITYRKEKKKKEE